MWPLLWLVITVVTLWVLGNLVYGYWRSRRHVDPLDAVHQRVFGRDDDDPA